MTTLIYTEVRHLIFTLFFSLVCIATYAQATCENNLIPNNADFELGTLGGWEILRGNAEITTDANSGNFAVVSHANGDTTGVAYLNAFFPNYSQTCVVSACGKIEGDVTAGFGVTYFNAFFQPIGIDSLGLVNTEYECFSVTMDVPPGTFAYAVSYAVFGDNGSFYLDDFCLECFDACNVGEACDDGDPNTQGDIINQYCDCEGSECGVIADAGPDVGIFPGQSATLTASGGIDYEWSTLENTQSISVAPASTSTYYVTVSDGLDCEDIDSVTVSVLAQYDIGSYVWMDTNGNGCFDSDEEGLDGVFIELFNDLNIRLTTAVSSTVNGQKGFYSFSVIPGTYKLKVQLPNNTVITVPDNCDDNSIDSDFDPSSRSTAFFELTDTDSMSIGLGLTTPLPVQLVGFEISNEGANNYLQWDVITEQDLEGYGIERRFQSEGKFQEVSFVSADDSPRYLFIDEFLPGSGTYYYRLVMRDNNGRQTLSDIKSVDVEINTKDRLLSYPNPTSGNLNVILNSTEEISTYEIFIFDQTGQLMLKEQVSTQLDYLSYQADLTTLNPGVYTLMIKAGVSSYVKKIVKLSD